MAHTEHKLGGLVEAALNKAMADEKWLDDMASDPDIEQNSNLEVFLALESYIVDELALRTVSDVLWDMHKIVQPGEYGLGDEQNDKVAWETMGTLLDDALKLVHNQGVVK